MRNKLILIIILILFFVISNQTKLYIYDNNINKVQIYTYNEGYNELNSKVYSPKQLLNQETYKFDNIFILDNSNRFRYDYIQESEINSFPKIKRIDYGFFTKDVYEYKDLNLSLNNIVKKDNNSYIISQLNDSYIEFDLSTSNIVKVSSTINFNNIVLVLLGLLILWNFNWIKSNIIKLFQVEYYYIYTFYVLLIVFICYLPFNHGPDEYTHIFSGSWYINHFFPPNTDSKIWLEPYYGINYILFSPDITYFLTFKVASLFEYFSFETLNSLRLSQLFIFIYTLFLISRYEKNFTYFILLLPLLVPQVAYMFTYVNGDILSLVFLAYAIVIILNKNKIDFEFAIAIFLLFNLKLNYTIIGLFFIFYFYIKNYKNFNVRSYILAIVIILISNYKKIYIMTFDKNLYQIILENASPLRVEKLQNMSIDFSVIFNFDWYFSSFKSFFAVFGYMSYEFNILYYFIFFVVFIYFNYRIFRNNIKYFYTVSFFLIINLMASLYYSASYDYQAQGRYLFPFLVVFIYFLSKAISKKEFAGITLITGLFGIVALLQFLLIKVLNG